MHVHRRHPLPFNFVSGFVYTIAVIVSIALGALFYKGIRSSQKNAPGHARDEVVPSPDLPPGAKVIVKQEKPAAPPPRPAPPKRERAPAAAPAAAEEVAEAQKTAEEPPPAAPEEEAAEPPSGELTPRLLPARRWDPLAVNLLEPHTVTLVPSADTTVFAEPAPLRAANYGAHDELILKGNDSFALLRYDIAPINGWTVRKAVWHAKVKRGLLREIGFSTVAADWQEGTGTPAKKSSAGVTFAATDLAGAKSIAQVVMGNGNSLTASGMPEPQVDQSNQWIAVELDPLLVQALVADASYGIAIFDAKGQVTTQPAGLFSRETSESHYIEVEGQLTDISPPGPIKNLRCIPHPHLQAHDGVGVILAWTAPGDDGAVGQAFKYDIRYSPANEGFDRATPVPRSQIPHPQPGGQADQAVIRNLDPETTYTFYVRATDEAGQGGPIEAVSQLVPSRFEPPPAPAPEAFKIQPIGIANQALWLEIRDELAGADPVTGTRFEAPDGNGEREASSYIWDRGTRALHLTACQNEDLGFLMVIGQSGAGFQPLKFSAEAFQGSAGEIPGREMTFQRVGYHFAGGQDKPGAWRGDALIPVDGYMVVPPDKKMPQQACQAVYAELHIPSDAGPGLYRSRLIVQSTNAAPDSVNVFLKVLPVRLPDRPAFTVELLAAPGFAALYKKNPLSTAESLPIERAYHRLAHAHRCTLAYLPYSANGDCPVPFGPPLQGEGLAALITSWTEWDERFGVYFDGTAFKDLPGRVAAAPHIILPVFENWPSALEPAYGCADWDVTSPRTRTPVYGGPAEQLRPCLDHSYWRAFRVVARQFADHFKERGWSESAGHIWLNNTPTNTYKGRPPPWSLGQPEYGDDFLALEAFAQTLAADAASGADRTKVVFRVRVPSATRLQGHGAGLFHLLTVSDADPAAWSLLRERAATYGETLWLESDAEPLEVCPLHIEARAVASFLEGADGWCIRSSLGRRSDWSRADPSALLYHGGALGREEPSPSLRLKALRRATQDIDLLTLLQQKEGWSRQQVAEFVRQHIPDRPGQPVASTAADWARLRLACQNLLAR